MPQRPRQREAKVLAEDPDPRIRPVAALPRPIRIAPDLRLGPIRRVRDEKSDRDEPLGILEPLQSLKVGLEMRLGVLDGRQDEQPAASRRRYGRAEVVTRDRQHRIVGRATQQPVEEGERGAAERDASSNSTARASLRVAAVNLDAWTRAVGACKRDSATARPCRVNRANPRAVVRTPEL